jgi:hypothetical protein
MLETLNLAQKQKLVIKAKTYRVEQGNIMQKCLTTSKAQMEWLEDILLQILL